MLWVVISGSIISASSSFSSSQTIESLGVISYPEIFVTVDFGKAICINNLSLGVGMGQEWKFWCGSPVSEELTRNASFKLVRILDWPGSCPRPCTYWNESAKTGKFNWTGVDVLVQKIFEVGAEPLFCLGGYIRFSGPQIPAGMEVNPHTDLPYPESFAAYVLEWVRHFKTEGWPVRFYEIVNEPPAYFGFNPINYTRLANYMQLFNATATSMRQENSNLSISFDSIMVRPVLDFWLTNGGADVDSLNFHKYGDWIAERYTDAKMLANAELEHFGRWPLGYAIEEAQKVWFNARGILLPIINSETNFNSAWINGTDPRNQQMVGAVWMALVLRMSILKGLDYSIYSAFASSASYGKTTPTGGAGFGMVNSDNNKPWYPYYVHYILGNNLSPSDTVVDTTSSSEDIRSLGWVHEGMLNIFIICKIDQTRILYIQGLQTRLNFFKIDNTIPWENPEVQTGLINPTEPIIIRGYTVTLLRAPISP